MKTITRIVGLLLCACGIAYAQIPPSIDTQPSSLTVTQNNSASFSVTASGDAPLTYQWRKNGNDILGAVTNPFVIPSAQPSDAAGYTVVVSNSFGSITSAVATLTVLVPINITGQPQSVTRTNGNGSATFTVTADGTTPAYQWRKNGSTITDATNSSYVVSPITTGSAGGYDVIVANSVNSQTSSVATLTVLVPPTITSGPTPSSLTVTQGTGASFSITASGDAPIGYQWYKGAAPVAGATSSTLNIASTVGSDSGSYTCVASNSSGTATSAVATLTVLVPASITSQPQNVTTPMGNSASFAVVAAGTTPISYQWYNAGGALADGGNISGATTATLALTNVPLSLNGSTYYVVVNNGVGSAVTSSVATLTVIVQSGIGFDFDTPGQFTNAPYNNVWNNWILNTFNTPLSSYEVAVGGTGPFPGSGAIDLAANNNADQTVTLLPATWDFSIPGKSVTASTMFKFKAPTVAGRRATQLAFITTTNYGINDNNPQSFMSVIVQSVTANNPTMEFRTQRRSSGGGLMESIFTQSSLTPSNWYKLNATFVNTRTVGVNSNFTIIASLQDMGPNGTTPGGTNLTLLTTTNSADMTLSTQIYLAIRSFEDGGVDLRDNTYVWTTNGSVYFVQNPQSQTVVQGQHAIFKALVDGEGPYTYQWFRNGIAIPGERAWNYHPIVTSADNGAQYTVQVTGPANVAMSAPATLTVTPLTLALVSAGSVDGTAVGLLFNQPVDPVSAANPANYTVNGSPAVAARVYRTSVGAQGNDGIYVVVTPASIVSGAFTVTANINDLSGNPIGGANSATASVANLTGADINIMTTPQGEQYSFGPGQYIVTGGGADIWNNADQFRFVYTTKTDDFDIKAKVPYLDIVRTPTKGGFNARVSLDPFSPDVTTAVNPVGNITNGSGGALQGQYARSYYEGGFRTFPNNSSASWGNTTFASWPNVWLRLRRVGNTFIRYSSTDGVNWLCDGQVSPNPAFPATLYVGLAVCSVANDLKATAQYENYGDFAGYASPVIAINSQPTNITVAAGSGATIGGLVATLSGGGAPNRAGELSYLWQRTNSSAGGWTNMPTAGATNNLLSVGNVFASDNGAQYRAILVGPGALSVTSAVATLTVTDTAGPSVSSVVNLATNAATSGFPAMQYPVREIVITFNEPVSAVTALNPLNYIVTNAAGVVPIQSVTFFNGDTRTVVITTSNALGAGLVGVTISGVTDLAGNPITANTKRVFRSFPPGKGPVVNEFYNFATGGQGWDVLTNHAAFRSHQPTHITYSNTMAWGAGGGGGNSTGDNYGLKAYTYFVPPTNGQYKFWVRSDDYMVLYMNTNPPGAVIPSTSPLGKVQITTNNVNATYSVGAAIPTATNLTLFAGQKYYMEVLLKEGGGNDYYSVMWTDSSSNAAPANTVMMPTFALEYPADLDATFPTPVVAEIYTGFFQNPLSSANGNLPTLTAATNFPTDLYNRDIPAFKYIAGIPDFVTYQPYFGWQPMLQQSGLDNYIARIMAYFVPPTNGNYKFYMRSDDSAQFYMNTNASDSTNPYAKTLLGRLDAFTSAYTLVAQNVSLVGGQKYYIEGLWREGGGGDGIAVAVRSQDDPNVPSIVQSGTTGMDIIPGSQLLPLNPPQRGGAVRVGGIAGNTTVRDGLGTILCVNQISGGGPYSVNWLKNGTPVLLGPTFGAAGAITNVIPKLTMADNGAVYTVIVSNLFSIASNSVTITVTPDSTPPTVVSTRGFRYGDGFSILFSEPMDPVTATFLGNYQISGGLRILSANLDASGTLATFTTTPQALGSNYTVTINGVRDSSSSANMIAANTMTSFSTWTVGGNNAFMVELWTNIVGGAVADLGGQAKYIANQPDLVWYTNIFAVGGTATSFSADSGLDNYGARVSGYFIPTNTGFYRFYLASDDASALFMNYDGANTADPAGKKMLVQVNGANLGYTNMHSSTPPIPLNVGQRYYIEAIFKEGTGGDYLRVTFRPTDASGAITGGTALDVSGSQITEVIPGAMGGGVPGNPDVITGVVPPPTDLYVTENDLVALTFNANMPQSVRNVGSFTWQKFDGASFTNIPGANGQTITPFFAQVTDDLAQYRVIASFPGLSNIYTTTLHVTADTAAPQLEFAGSLDGTSLLVRYARPVNRDDATLPLYYDLDGQFFETTTENGGAGYMLTDRRTIIFNLAPNSYLQSLVGSPFNANVIGIRSAAATPVTGDSTFTGARIEFLSSSEIGVPIGNAIGGYNPTVIGFPAFDVNGNATTYSNSAVVVTNGGFTVRANGYDIWNTADGNHYLYRQVAGNFDIKVRVQSLTGADQWSKAGLMVRTGITNNSRNVFFGVAPTTSPIGTQPPVNNYTFQWRDIDGGASGNFTTTTNPPAYPNAWVRLARVGSVFSAYLSSNGVDWVLYSSRDTAVNPGGAYPAQVYLGIATASHDQTRGLANNAVAEYRNLYFPLAPTILTQPVPDYTNVPIHTTVTFSGVTASGFGPISFQWIKDGFAISGATNASLTITNSAVSDGGVYNVVVGNDGGGVISSNCVLVVSNALPQVVNDSINVNENTLTNINPSLLLGNDVDPEGDALTLLGVSGVAPASYNASFDDNLTPAGMTIFAVANVQPAGGANNTPYLQLNSGAGSLAGGAVINELTPGKRVKSFSASFKVRISDASAEPADGMSFNFGPDLPDSAVTPAAAEQGGTAQGFSFCIDNYRFAPLTVGAAYTAPGGGNANTAGIKINYNGIIVAGVQTPVWNSTRWIPITITVSETGVANIVIDGTNALSNITLPGYVAKTGRFGFYGRTGGAFESHGVDDIAISALTLDTGRVPFTDSSLYGVAYLTATGGVANSGVLHLTDAVNNHLGTFVINDILGGSAMTAFNASFQMKIQAGSVPGADGFSFNFANDLPNAGVVGAESGVGSGLSVGLRNYPTGSESVVVKFAGTTLATVPISVWNSPNFFPVTLNLTADGKLTVTINGTNVVSGLTTGYTPTAGRFGIYARCGGLNQTHWVDDLSINAYSAGGSGYVAKNFDNTGGPGTVTYSGGTVNYHPDGNQCGTDSFYYLVSDGQQGGVSLGVVNVTIVPTNSVPPSITSCPANQTIAVGAGCTFAVPEMRGSLLANGACLTVSQSPAPGTLLGTGTHTITFTVTDVNLAQATCQATITAVDATAPSLTCPADITAEATSASGAVVTFSASATDNCGVPTVNYSPASGSTFPIGTNLVTVTAYDTALNTNTCTFRVIVRDTTAPSIVCPADQLLTCTSTNGMQAFYTVTATDAVDPAPVIVVTPASGSYFTLGTNIVSATATDAYGNQSGCTFKIVVQEPLLSLAISKSDTNVVITWPQSCLTHQLQQSDDLSSPSNWGPCGATVEVVGSLYRVTIPADQAKRFYQLKKP